MAGTHHHHESDAQLAAALRTELAWVRRLARRLVGAAAEDLTQDVALAALRARPPGERLRAWLGGATRRRAARWHRDAHRRAQIESAAPERPAPEDPADMVDRLHWQRALVDAVLALPEPYRAVVVARYFDDLSPKEIAERRGVAAATVRQQVSRGLAMLRARLEATHGKDWRAGLGVLFTLGGTRAGSVLGVMAMAKKSIGAALAVVILGVVVGFQWPRTAPPNLDADAARGAMRSAGTAAVEVTELDRDAVAIADPRANAELDLRIVTASGQPVANADIVVGNEELAQRARADDHGRVSMPASDGRGHALVLASARPPRLFELDGLSGEHTLTMPDGACVAGHVELLGDPAQVPFLPELQLEPSGFDSSALPAAFAEQVNAAALGTISMRPGNGRSFAFDGLPEDWRGTISIDARAPFWLSARPVEAPRRSVPLTGPREDLRLFLTPLPGLFGRLVWEDRSPVANASISIAFTKPDESPLRETQSSAEGWFAVRVDSSWDTAAARVPPALQQVSLWVRHEAVTRTQPWTIAAEDLGPGNDIGEIVVERAVAWHVLVLDEHGAPVEDALVESARAQRTDAAGRAIVRADRAAPRTLRIGARGARVDGYVAEGGSGTARDPLRFVVQAGNALTVRVRSRVIPLDRLLLELRSHVPAFTATDEPWHVPTGYHTTAGGAAFYDGQHDDGPPATWTTTFEIGPDGVVRLVSLQPSTQIRLRVLDRTRGVGAQRRLLTPAAGSKSDVELRATGPVTRLSGTVQLAGEPLRDASVLIRGTKHVAHDRTAADGTFDLAVFASGRRASLCASHPAAVAPPPRDVLLVPGEQVLQFDLARGHDVEIRVQGPDHVPLDARLEWLDAATNEPLAASIRSEHLACGRWRWSDLPSGPLRIRARLPGRSFHFDVEVPSPEEVVLRIPDAPHRAILEPPATELAHVRVRLTDELGHSFRVSVQRRVDGTWIHPELWLFPGTYDVVVTAEGCAPATTRWLVPSLHGRLSVPAPRPR